jgi:DNA-binding response OmpR family regulator
VTSANQDTVVVVEDIKDEAKGLKRELEKHAVRVEICANLPELRRVARHLDDAGFAVDIFLGDKREDEGIQAIRELKELEAAKKSCFYVAALTSRSEFSEEATKAGADAFLVKTTPRTDALELLARISAHKVANDTKRGESFHAQLATREYKNLCRQLKRIKCGAVDEQQLDVALITIRRAMNWPFLSGNEKLILSGLEQLLSSARGNEQGIDAGFRSLFLFGAKLLGRGKTDQPSVFAWLRQAHLRESDIILKWIGDSEIDKWL